MSTARSTTAAHHAESCRGIRSVGSVLHPRKQPMLVRQQAMPCGPNFFTSPTLRSDSRQVQGHRLPCAARPGFLLNTFPNSQQRFPRPEESEDGWHCLGSGVPPCPLPVSQSRPCSQQLQPAWQQPSQLSHASRVGAPPPDFHRLATSEAARQHSPCPWLCPACLSSPSTVAQVHLSLPVEA